MLDADPLRFSPPKGFDLVDQVAFALVDLPGFSKLVGSAWEGSEARNFSKDRLEGIFGSDRERRRDGLLEFRD